MKNIFLLITLFIATNSFAQEVKNIPPPPPEKTETIDDEDEDSVFQEVEIESTFPGGIDAWRKFLQKNLKANTPAKNGAKVGRYNVIVRFVVGKDGKLSDFVIEENAGYGTGEEVVRMLKKSPKWIPGVQNGRTVSSLKRQPVTFLVEYN
jgi:periplasmic protein TonB